MCFYRNTTPWSPCLASPLCLWGIWCPLPLKWRLAVSVCLGFYSNILQTGRLNQQTLIFSQSWRLVIQNQGAVRAGFWWEVSWFVAGRLLWVLARRDCRALESLPLLLRAPVLPARVLPWGLHLTLITPLKALSSNTITVKVRALIYEFEGGGTQFRLYYLLMLPVASIAEIKFWYRWVTFLLDTPLPVAPITSPLP